MCAWDWDWDWLGKWDFIIEGDEVSEVSDDSSSERRDGEKSGGVESSEVVEGKCEVQQVRLRAVGALEVLAKEEADLAMASRYLVATTVRALSVESWVALYPTDWQIYETAILAMANENSDGFWGSFEDGFLVLKEALLSW